MNNRDEPSTPDEIAIALVIRPTSEPIDGTIELPNEQPVPFTGWMQLTQMLSRAVTPTPPQGSEAGSSDPDDEP